jgi:membrane protein EpsK
LTISIAHFRRKACKQLFSTSGWMALNQLGAILYWSIDLLIVNNMFGPDAGGRYAAVLQWSVLLRTMAGMVVSLFVPTMLYCYARHDIDGLVIYTRRAIKFMGLLMALPIGMICGFSVPILRTWLGPSFVDLSWLMSLMTISLSLTVAVFPLFGIENATNRVRMPAIVTLLLGIVNLGLAIFLAGPMGWGLYGVAAATAIALTVKNITFTPLYSAHILGCRISAFLLETVPILLATLATAGVGLLMSHVWDLSGWLRLIPAVAVLSAVYLAVVYSMLLNSEERQMAWKMVRSFVPSKGT